ncbi:hypothetical protein [Neobacillus mesonae]|uniref:hypothetical protein n=1 Tax=Neobacillus mesonae TaxID=1193713 RepID=UPI00204196E3|nr:hypothetical protein [Neobacillus mesonae]MCM3569574.1 hypothetical protein [Neobacillus mesonae]
MGLYMNKRQNPGLYKNNKSIQEPNQAYSRRDFLTEIMKEQEQANAALKHSLAELKSRTMTQEKSHLQQWNQVDQQLTELRKNNLEQKDFEQQIIQFLQTLKEKNIHFEKALEDEALIKENMLEKVNELSESLQEMKQRLEVQDKTNQQMTKQIDEQLEIQKNTAAKQEEFQGEVLQRLDNQEALTEKMLRQLNHIRSIIFERTNFLASKIEDGYKLTSSYVYKLMTGSEQPLTFFMLNQKKEEDQKKAE